MDDGNGVIFNEVYRGSTTNTIISNLTPGVEYSFKVSAVNFNGEGDQSLVGKIRSCVAPMNVSAPTLISSTSTTVTLRWTQPGNTGGCPITSYAIYRDDGNNGAFSTNMDAASVANKPNLFEHSFTISALLTGLPIRYKLEAENVIGKTMSGSFLTAILAGIPATPTLGPIDVTTITDSTKIGVSLPVVTDDGGSMIISYHLVMDDGQNGPFTSIVGDSN